MNADPSPGSPAPAAPVTGGNTIEALPGEAGIPNIAQPTRVTVSKRGLATVAFVVVSLVVASTLYVQHYFESRKKPDELASKRASDRPAAASTEPKRLDMSASPAASATSPVPNPTRIPALVPTADELVDPIAVRRTGPAAPTPSGAKAIAPEDAPAVLVSSRPDTNASSKVRQNVDSQTPSGEPLDQTRRNLDAYQHRLQGLMDTLSQTTAMASASAPSISGPGALPMGVPSPEGTRAGAPSNSAGGLFGGQLQGSATPRVAARFLGNRSLILPKGTAFTCALKTRVVSAASGMVGCLVQRNVYSDDGRVLLIERGSHMDGEYRITSVRPGTVRIPVLWTRIRTPNGVTVDIDSPGTGPLGESGIDGYVDNRWVERIGAAMLLSLIDDSVSLLIQRGSNGQQGNTVLLPSTSTSTSKIAEKVLDSTINVPPLIYQNQGGIVGIYVARDVDFSSVYELRPVER